MSKALKYIAIIVAVFLLLVIALLALTQTAYFRDKLKQRLIAEAGQFVDLDLSIEKLNGNLYREIELNGIRLAKHDTLVAWFNRITLEYRLLAVLKGEVLIDSLVIDSPEVHLKQAKDSSWNLSDWLVDNINTTTQKNTARPWLVRISQFELNNGRIQVDALSEMIPEAINNFNLKAGARIKGNQVEIDLQQLGFNTLNPEISLKELHARYRMDNSGIQIENLVLRTAGSGFNAQAGYRSLQNMDGTFNAETIDSKELAIFIPKLELLCSPEIKTQFKNTDDNLEADVELMHENQKIVAKIQIKSATGLVSGKGPVSYSAHLGFTNFAVEEWIKINTIQTTLEGTIDLQGENLLDRNAKLTASANLRNSSFNEVRFNSLKLDGHWGNDDLLAEMVANTDFGWVNAKAKIKDPFKEKEFAVELDAEGFNAGVFLPALQKTIINGRLVASGSDFNLERMKAEAAVTLTNSTLYGFAVDSLNSTAKFANSQIAIDSVSLFVPGISAAGSGDVQLDSSRLDLLLQAHADSLTAMDSLIQLPIEFDSINTISRLSGPFSALQLTGEAKMYRAKGYDALLREATTGYRVILDPDSVHVAAKARVAGVDYLGIAWDSMFVNLNYGSDRVDVQGRILVKDTLDLFTAAQIELGDTMKLRVPQLEIGTLLSDYYLRDTLSAMVMGTDELEINNFLLLDRNNPGFRLSAGGHVAMSDTNAFHVAIDQLDLEPLDRFFITSDSIGGVFTAEMELSGRPDNPEISGTFEVQKPYYNHVQLTGLNGNFSYRDQKAYADLRNPVFGEGFSAGFSAPFHMYFDSTQFIFNPPDSFNASFNLKDIQVHNYLADAVPGDSLKGVLNAQIEAGGKFSQPQIYGSIRLTDALYQNQRLGLDYQNAKAAINFDGNKVKIDTMFIRQKDGMISLTGDLAFDSTIVTGTIISSSLQADADNFYVARSRNYELLIDANTFLKMGQSNPEFGGRVKVLRSDVYLPGIINRETDDGEENEPMLVQALNEKRDSTSLVQSKEVVKKDKNDSKSAMLNDVTGRLNIEIQRNTWIRSNDMRLEVRGDVDIVKTGPYFELFGELRIVRGHYILYGKKLNIKESEVIFEGGEKLDPTLNFNAEYVYRGSDREKRYLDLMVTGKLSEPEISFKLDEAEITETDGISVLLFGATSDEMGYGEQNGLVGSIGSNAVASLITSQLSRTIGAQLNLDMIEVTATENWKSAAFVVGKYITNDIFVIYERGFGEEEGNEITPETITVEYELNDKLFLRLQSGNSITSGVDVILKFEQELEK